VASVVTVPPVPAVDIETTSPLPPPILIQTFSSVVASVQTNASPEVEFIQKCPTAKFDVISGSVVAVVESVNSARVVAPPPEPDVVAIAVGLVNLALITASAPVLLINVVVVESVNCTPQSSNDSSCQ
jgi:hypothetical protein